jgi:hypothetical protein
VALISDAALVDSVNAVCNTFQLVALAWIAAQVNTIRTSQSRKNGD